MKRGLLTLLLKLLGYDFVIDVIRQRVADYNNYKLYQWPDGGIAIYNPRGRRLIRQRFDEVIPVIQIGIILVRRHALWGAINLQGATVLKVEWANIGAQNGYLIAQEASRRGYVGVYDTLGETVVEPNAYQQIQITLDDSIICTTDYGRKLRFQR